MRSRVSFATGVLLAVAFVAAMPMTASAQEIDFTAQGERPLAIQRRQAAPAPEVQPAKTGGAEAETDAQSEPEALSNKKPKSAASVAAREKAGEPDASTTVRAASRAKGPGVVPSPGKQGVRKTSRKSSGGVRMAAVDCEVLALFSRLRSGRL